MNRFPKGSNYLVLVLCLLLSTLFISELTYSHSIPTPVDIKSEDGTPVELVTHIDLYDDDGNFITHLHEWSISRYTQEEVDEIHANNPHTSEAVIESLPEEGDVKGISQRSYDTPYFPPPDDASEIGKPDPEGEYDNYGSVSTPVENNEDASVENSEGTAIQEEVVPAIEYARATAEQTSPQDNPDKGEVEGFIEGGGSQDTQQQPPQDGGQVPQQPIDNSQNEQPIQDSGPVPQQPVDNSQNEQPIQDSGPVPQQPVDNSQNEQPIQDSGPVPQQPIDNSQNGQPTTSVPTGGNTGYGYVENSMTASRELEIVGIVEKEHPRRLVVTLRNNGQNFVDLTDGWSLTLVRPDGSTASVNMKSRRSLFITPYNNNDGVYADTDILLLPKSSFVELDTQERLFLDFPYFYGQQSGYSQDDVLILSYEGAEMSRYPEAVGNAPRLRTSLITTWGSMKKAE